MRSLAQHKLLEFYHCDRSRIEHARRLKGTVRKAVLAGGGTIVKAVFHDFSPYGVSGVIIITESHVAIHTWPEHAYAAVDIFSCGEKLNQNAIRDYLKHALASRRVTEKTFHRGIFVKSQRSRAYA